MILEATLKADYSPGTNQSEDLACADWRFLLPSMELGQVVCIGIPRRSALRVLSTLASEIIVITATPVSDALPGHPRVVTAGDASFEFKANSISLVLISDRGAIRRVHRDKAYLDGLLRALRHDGCICFEQSGVEALVAGGPGLGKVLRHIDPGCVQSFWVTKKSGEVRTAVPVQERYISNYFFKNVLHGMSFKKRVLSRGGQVASYLGLMPYLNQGRLSLIRGTRGEQAFQPPDFLREMAAAQGVQLDGYRYGLAARGTYNSNKIIYHLFKAGHRDADIVIKMTRVAEFNCRLEHEWEMLSMVQQKELAKSGTYPSPLFFGYHNGLAVLAEQAMRGHPFRTTTTAQPGCPIASDALQWITDLGSHSANRTVATPTEVSRELGNLFELFVDIYDFEPSHVRFMRDQIETVADIGQDFPVVFGHGDAGTWNVVTDPQGKAVFLDWEAAEPRGMPLWDLFYFFRSFGNWVLRRRERTLDTHKNFERNFMQRGELNDRLVQATKNYCAAVGLDTSLISPMFYTCWMHRALRQATWADSLTKAHFVSVLRMSIENPEAPGLRALFNAD